MKKQFFNKVTSILLVFVMVLALVPMAIPAVYAEEADVVLSADTLVIDSVADWKAVAGASASTDFAGKVVKLGGNIAFGEEAAPVLFSGTFAGTFYGNGYTVSGKTLAGNALIAATVVGGTVSGDDAEGSGNKMTITGFSATASAGKTAFVASTIKNGAKVKNIAVVDCSINSANKGNAAAIVAHAENSAANDYDTRISNCSVENVALSVMSQGAIILGNVADTKGAYVTVENCHVTGTTTVTGSSYTVSENASAGLAAVVGKVNSNAYLTVDSCTVGQDVSVTSQNNRNWAFAIGMIVGHAGKNNNGALIVKNCIAAGMLKSTADKYSKKDKSATDSSVGTISAGGIVGYLSFTGKNEITNCTSSVTFDTSAGGLAIGQICGAYVGEGSGSLTISNCNSIANVNANEGNHTIGGILGNYQGTDSDTNKASLTISKCNVSGTIADPKKSGGSPRMAAIIGRGQKAADGNVVIEQCHIDADISANASYDKIGGFVGDWDIKAAKLYVRDSYFEGSVVSGQGKSAGAIVGNKGSNVSQTTVSIENVILNVANSLPVCKNQNFTNVSNCYTTNGNVSANGFITVENESIIDGLIKRDANGFVESVRGYVNCNLVQVAKQSDGKYAARFIATSVFDDVSAATMSVSIGDYKFDVEESTIVDSLEAYGDSDAMTKINSEAYGAEKFCAILVKNVDPENLADVVFTISFTATVEGAEYKADFTGSIPAEALV